MLGVSITHNNVTEEERIALDNLLNYINHEFNKIIVSEHDTEYSEHKIIYQLYRKKKYNSRGAGRSGKINKEELCNYALNNPHYTMAEIGEHFNCTQQYVSKILNESNNIIKYKKLHKSIK